MILEGFNLLLFSKYKLKNFIKDYYFIGPSQKVLNSKKIKNIKKLNFKKYTKNLLFFKLE